MRELSVLLAVMVVVGCGSESSVPESDGAEERVAEGTIRQVGSAPNAVTRIETVDGPIVVVGPLGLEIARAAGAVARVHGTASASGASDTIQAARYELVSVDGLRPLVGNLDLRDGSVVLETKDGRQVELLGGSDRMRAAAGSKVWITTRDDGRSIVRWGILSTPEQ